MKQPILCGSLWLLALSAFFTPPLLAAECSASSGVQTIALLELYTSEGCSSCPPADRWLGKLVMQGFAPDRVIPLALHVDYWDSLGWKDSFAKLGFAHRQREMAGLNRSSFVYTPQVMLNGRDYRGWGSAGRFASDIAAINRNPARANIKLTINQLSTGSIEVSATVQALKQGTPVLYVALYENDLTTAVKAGENSGASLHHDYVVREWLGPYSIDDKTTSLWQQKLALKPDWKVKDMGAVAFVQNRASGEVLQAVALRLCGDA
jgi:hypothetical protein